jgi:amino acid adenylation domain-containing protein
LTLSLQESSQGFAAKWEFNSDLFDTATIERMAGHFERLLRHALAEPQRCIGQLPLLDEAERDQLLVKWNDTAIAGPAQRTIHELFEDQVARTPKATALVFEDDSLTYAQLNARANRWAHHLIALGVGPDTCVAIALPRGIEMVVALLATLKAGGAYVPLDPDYPTERLAFMLADSAPRVLITQATGRAALGLLLPSLAVVELDTAARPWDGMPDTNPDARALGLHPSHLAYVIYTSGSTGMPKGVAIEHRSAANLIEWARASFEPSVLDRTLFSTSLNFDLAVFECFVPLCSGAAVCLVRNALVMQNSPQEVTLINTVPSALSALVDAHAIPQSVHTVNVAGEPLKRELVQRIFDHSSVHTVCNLYGPSETTTYSTWCAMDRTTGFHPSIGRPIAHTRIYILDAHGALVPAGVAGEIHIGGAGVARGYLNRPDLTAERFVPDPFAAEPGARLYKTGDLGRWRADGTIEFLGRNDHQVKIRGFRIELGEIEARLLELPGVREAAVLAREDLPGEKRLVAYVAGENALQPEALRTHLGASLPEYMVPAAYVQLDALPLTPNGKLDRRALPAPEGDAYGTRAYEAPQGELESTFAAIWSELLGVERIGRHDNFFALGGHSLLALQAVSRLSRRLGREVPVHVLFSTPTVAALAHEIGKPDGPEEFRHIVTIRSSGSHAPLFIIHAGDGEVGYAFDLAPHLPADRPLYALAAIGFADGEAPLSDVEAMASAYVRAMRSVQPHGPYHLVGWSSGGMIAYEIAAQLLSADEQVGFVGVIDTLRDFSSGGAQALTEAQFLVRTVLKDVEGNLARQIAALAEQDDIDAIFDLCQSEGIIPATIERATLRRHLAVRYAIGLAVANYRAQPIAVPLALFTAADEGHADSRLGWAEITEHGLDVAELPGTHWSIVDPDHIRALGAAISRALVAGTRGSFATRDAGPAASVS